MSVDSVLEDALELVIAKAQQPERALAPLSATIECVFGDFNGAAATTPVPLVAGQSMVLRSDISGAQLIEWSLFADAAVTAQVDVRIGTYTDFPGFAAMYGAGQAPTLSAARKNSGSTSAWASHYLDYGDLLSFTITSLTGTCYGLLIALSARRVDAGIGAVSIVDSAGTEVVDNAGNPVIVRS